MIRILPKYQQNSQPLKPNTIYMDCTSHNPINKYDLSPFLLGPVSTYNGLVSKNIENAWQYSKVYKQFTDQNDNPTKEYFIWRNTGFDKTWADRHPMGKEKPLYAYWKINGEYTKLDYIQARKQIYIPLYASQVIKTKTFEQLQKAYTDKKDIILYDFDAYDHIAANITYADVINNPHKRMGHAFVIAMLLDGYLQI